MTSRKAKKNSQPQRSKVYNKQRKFRIHTSSLTRFSESVLNFLRINQEVAVALVNDATIQSYNRTFLNHDFPTDVIAFSYGSSQVRASEASYLGDIVISVETAARNAKRYKISLLREIRNLVLHGILHLLGYDHLTDRGEMRALERKLRRKLN